jgi:hypothetical protein
LSELEKNPDGHELVHVIVLGLKLVPIGQDKQLEAEGPKQLAHEGWQRAQSVSVKAEQFLLV